MTFKYPIRTRYSETGQDGIIHHPSYIIYFEVARLEFFKARLECDINELEKQKIFCPVVSVSAQYLKPLLSSEDIVVQVERETCSKVRFSLIYEVFRENACVARGNSVHCFVNEFFKPIPIPQLIHKNLTF